MTKKLSVQEFFQQLPVTFTDTTGHETTYLLIGEFFHTKNHYLIFTSLKKTAKNNDKILILRELHNADYLIVPDQKEVDNIFKAFNDELKKRFIFSKKDNETTFD